MVDPGGTGAPVCWDVVGRVSGMPVCGVEPVACDVGELETGTVVGGGVISGDLDPPVG